mgnify:CR=1 FL=1
MFYYYCSYNIKGVGDFYVIVGAWGEGGGGVFVEQTLHTTFHTEHTLKNAFFSEISEINLFC